MLVSDAYTSLDRAFILLKRLAVILAIGLLYNVLSAKTGLRIPCIIYERTGLYCPGCGLTRFCSALLRLDFRAAAYANPMLFVLCPVLLLLCSFKAAQYIRTGSVPIRRTELVFWGILAAGALIFGILRNLPMFAYLQPR